MSELPKTRSEFAGQGVSMWFSAENIHGSSCGRASDITPHNSMIVKILFFEVARLGLLYDVNPASEVNKGILLGRTVHHE